MSALSDFAENKVVDALLRGQPIGVPATWYIALYTAAPTDSTGGTEVTGGAYARVAVPASVTTGLTSFAGTHGAGTVVASTGTGGLTSNNAAVTFPTPTAGWGVVTHWGVADALTAGAHWIYAPLTITKTIDTGDAVSFAAGALTVTLG